jgi:hypothetical protein
MGGEILVWAAAEDERIGAVVADGVEARTPQELRQSDASMKWAEAPFFMVAARLIEVLSGVPPAPSNLDLAGQVAPRPLLLVSAGGAEADWSRLLIEAAGPGAELWETGVGHTQAFRKLPDEFEARAIAVFDEGLLGE